jgi:hypothetical protein
MVSVCGILSFVAVVGGTAPGGRYTGYHLNKLLQLKKIDAVVKEFDANDAS